MAPRNKKSDKDYFTDDLKSYKGNPLLKRVGENIEWNEYLVTEYAKCKEDPLYFIENYMKIVNVDKGLVNFDLYDYQKEMISNFSKYRNNIVTTARQAGKCFSLNTMVNVRNKKTGEIENIKIGDFYERMSNLQKQLPSDTESY